MLIFIFLLPSRPLPKKKTEFFLSFFFFNGPFLVFIKFVTQLLLFYVLAFFFFFGPETCGILAP